MRAARFLVAGAVALSAAGASLVGATSANATAGPCASEEACLFFNSNYQGATFSDGRGNSQTPENYGDPNWYTFSNGNGAGYYVKNNAASVWNYDMNYSLTIYFNSNNMGPSQYIKRGTGANLNTQLKNNDASQCYDFFNVCP